MRYEHVRCHISSVVFGVAGRRCRWLGVLVAACAFCVYPAFAQDTGDPYISNDTSPSHLRSMFFKASLSLKGITLTKAQEDSILAIDAAYKPFLTRLNAQLGGGSLDLRTSERRRLVLREREQMDFRKVLTKDQQVVFDRNMVEARKIDAEKSRKHIEDVEQKVRSKNDGGKS